MGLFNKNKDSSKNSEEKGFSFGKGKKDKSKKEEVQEVSESKNSPKSEKPKKGLLSGLKKDKKPKDIGIIDENKDSVVSIGGVPKGKNKGKKSNNQLKLLSVSFVVLILIASTAYFVLPVLLGTNQGTIKTDTAPNTTDTPEVNTNPQNDPQVVNDSTVDTNSVTEPDNAQVAEQPANIDTNPDSTQETNNNSEVVVTDQSESDKNISDNEPASSEPEESVATEKVQEAKENTESNFKDLAGIKIYREE